MEPIDYNNKLSDVRRNYRNSLKNMRQEQREHIDHIEKAHKYQRGKQRETYDEKIRDYEDQNRDASQQFTKKTKEVIAKKNQELKNTLAGERKEFEQDNREMRKTLSKKLDGLKDSFGRSKREMKKHYDRSTEQNNRLVKDKISHAYDQNNKVVKNLIDTHGESFNKVNEKAKAEKNQIIRKHKAYIGKQVNEDSDARQRMNKEHQQEVKALRDNYREKLGMSRQHYMDQVDRLKGKNKNEKENQTRAYEDLARISTDRNGSEVRRFNEVADDRVRSVQKRMDRQTRDLKRTAHSQLGSAEDKISQLGQKNRRLGDVASTKDKEHRNEMDDVKQSHLRKLKLVNDDFAKELLDRSYITKEEKTKKDSMFHKRLNKLHEKFRDGQEGLVSKYRTEISDMKKHYSGKSVEERKISNKILYNQKKDFGSAIKMITEKNKYQTREMQKGYDIERRNLMAKAESDIFRKSMDVREELSKRYGSQQKQMERKIDIKEKENFKNEMRYSSKLETLKNKFMDEINQQQQMELARRDAERLETKKMVDNINEDHYRQLVAVKSSFDQEILKSKNVDAIKQEEMVANYERKLRHNHIDGERKLKAKLAEARDRFDRMKSDYDTRLLAMKSQYEMRMEKLRQANLQSRNAEDLQRRSTIS